VTMIGSDRLDELRRGRARPIQSRGDNRGLWRALSDVVDLACPGRQQSGVDGDIAADEYATDRNRLGGGVHSISDS